MTVHLLKYGLAVCGAGMPNSWPPGDAWVGFTDTENLPKVDCPGCLTPVAEPCEQRPAEVREPAAAPKAADLVVPDTWVGFKKIVDFLVKHDDAIVSIFVRDVSVVWRFGLWAGSKKVARGRSRSEVMQDAIARRHGGITFGIGPVAEHTIELYVTGKSL